MERTAAPAAEERLAQMSSLYRALRDTSEAIIRVGDEAELLQRICDIALRLGGFRMVLIALRDQGRGVLSPKAMAGELAALLQGIEIPMSPPARSLIGEVLREGRTVVSNDYQADEERSHWRAHPMMRGVASGLCTPLRQGAEIIGVFVVAAEDVGHFDAEITHLLESMGEDISFGLDSLRRAKALREAEEQLRLAQKMEAIGRLAGGIAHDFNNLLSVIGSYAQFVMEELGDASPHHGDMNEIVKATKRASTLTRQLLAFGRKQLLKPEVIELNALVAGVGKMLERVIGNNVALRFLLGAGVGTVKVDPGQMEQVLMNLALNARDAMPSGGVVTIATASVERAEGAAVMLSVADTGVGMDEPTQARIFEPFFTTKAVGKGTGLGLATVYGIVKQSGGSISVESRVGEGTVFKIYLPRCDA